MKNEKMKMNRKNVCSFNCSANEIIELKNFFLWHCCRFMPGRWKYPCGTSQNITQIQSITTQNKYKPHHGIDKRAGSPAIRILMLIFGLPQPQLDSINLIKIHRTHATIRD